MIGEPDDAAIFEFDLRAPVIGAQREPLLDGHVGRGWFPLRLIGAHDLDVAIHQAQPHDAGVTVAGVIRAHGRGKEDGGKEHQGKSESGNEMAVAHRISSFRLQGRP